MAGKKVSQNDLRKAMNEIKKKSGGVKKIVSPLAKYNDAGLLMCVLCKTIVRSETIWPVHLNSRSHKDSVIKAKKSIEEQDEKKRPPVIFKRPCSPTRESGSSKKSKGILKNSNSSLSNLPADFFDATGDKSRTAVASVTKATENLEIDKDSNKNEEKAGEAEQVKEAEANASASLPEGFFDDPILDAKVRNVEYKDPIEEEWDKFQKEIKEEAAQSAQIIAEDQEESTTERQLDEIEEQIRHWSRVMDLVRQKDQVQAVEKMKESIKEEMSSGDESDYDEFLDWRVKSSN